MTDVSGVTELTAVDIGGTHVRFAPAIIRPGQRPQLGEAVVFRTADYAGLASAWRNYCVGLDQAPADAMSICFAGPVRGDTLQATNSHWVLNRPALEQELGLSKVHLMNDFGAMAHGVAVLSRDEFQRICGPSGRHDPQSDGVTTVIGPGTGLGVALLIRSGGQVKVVETEGGHIDFAPLDAMESAILSRLREQYLRVSAERIVSGPGLANLVQAIASIEQRPMVPVDDATLWRQALEPGGADDLPRLALQRFCMSYGSVAGDLALAHGASRVVLAGGLSQRLAATLGQSQFAGRFVAKGRYQSLMAELPVELALFDQLGLLGAAAGFGSALQTPNVKRWPITGAENES